MLNHIFKAYNNLLTTTEKLIEDAIDNASVEDIKEEYEWLKEQRHKRDILKKIGDILIDLEESKEDSFDSKASDNTEGQEEAMSQEDDWIVENTDRGFEMIEFEDAYNQRCTLQQSSAIGNRNNPGKSFIWLGLALDRMHLNKNQVKKLIRLLDNWLKTGSFKKG